MDENKLARQAFEKWIQRKSREEIHALLALDGDGYSYHEDGRFVDECIDKWERNKESYKWIRIPDKLFQ